ncbi:hypothetical protein AB4851_14015 [Burkholderia sp. 22PA0099]|uniref:hypothetical protein n=1 Tax=Burkholderia sp. 22PA0099 TaxID=3237372 RepID=UPI0039C24D2B
MRPVEPSAGWRISAATAAASRGSGALRRRAFVIGEPARHARHVTAYRGAQRAEDETGEALETGSE